jgi:hypothetical protein
LDLFVDPFPETPVDLRVGQLTRLVDEHGTDSAPGQLTSVGVGQLTYAP